MSILEATIGLLAPPECVGCGDEGSALCSRCAGLNILPFGQRCWRCSRLSRDSKTCPSCAHTGSPNHVWIVTDHDNLARDLLSIYKFGHQRAAAMPIAKLMSALLLANDQPSTDYLAVPVPTATSRVRERSFGHTELLARKISHSLKCDYAACLRRLGQSRQLGAARDRRLEQLSQSFAVKAENKIRGRNILLIDDVVTTGGTIKSAAKVLRAAEAKRVDALLFAKRL